MGLLDFFKHKSSQHLNKTTSSDALSGNVFIDFFSLQPKFEFNKEQQNIYLVDQIRF